MKHSPRFVSCHNCGTKFEGKRSWQKFCSVSCRTAWHTAGLASPCAYCGNPATTEDHIPPKTDRDRIVALGLGKANDFVEVLACFECNCALGGRGLWTVAERRRFIRLWLRKRYARFLKAPDWTEAELARLGPGLQKFVIHKQAVKENVAARIAWASKGHA